MKYVRSWKEHRPVSIGQASRISGITPAAISTILVNLKTRHAKTWRMMFRNEKVRLILTALFIFFL